MKPEEQIKALAELDGFVLRDKWWTPTSEDVQRMPRDMEDGHPLYLTSYDAIIPLIQKQDIEIRRDVYRNLIRDKSGKIRHTVDIGDAYISTPSQLCEALLRATENWKA